MFGVWSAAAAVGADKGNQQTAAIKGRNRTGKGGHTHTGNRKKKHDEDSKRVQSRFFVVKMCEVVAVR